MSRIDDSKQELDDNLLMTIAAGSSLPEFISSVSDMAIKNLLDPLAVLVGRNLLLASMLVDGICRIFASADLCKVEIFFDAPSRSEKMRAPNVREVNSGGGNSENRADRAIVEYLEYCCSHMSTKTRILITDDRELRKEAVERGARIMPVPEFGAFLECANPVFPVGKELD